MVGRSSSCRNSGIVHTDGGPFRGKEGNRAARILELEAIARAIERNSPLLTGFDVVLVTDSKPNTRYFRDQPTIPHDTRTEKLLDKIENQEVQISRVVYLQGEKLLLADYVSRAASLHDVENYEMPTIAELHKIHRENFSQFQKHMENIMALNGCTDVTSKTKEETMLLNRRHAIALLVSRKQPRLNNSSVHRIGQERK